MVNVGDRVTVASRKVGQQPRLGTVLAVRGLIISVRWDSGEESSFIPSQGSLLVDGRATRKEAKGVKSAASAKRPASAASRPPASGKGSKAVKAAKTAKGTQASTSSKRTAAARSTGRKAKATKGGRPRS